MALFTQVTKFSPKISSLVRCSNVSHNNYVVPVPLTKQKVKMNQSVQVCGAEKDDRYKSKISYRDK